MKKKLLAGLVLSGLVGGSAFAGTGMYVELSGGMANVTGQHSLDGSLKKSNDPDSKYMHIGGIDSKYGTNMATGKVLFGYTVYKTKGFSFSPEIYYQKVSGNSSRTNVAIPSNDGDAEITGGGNLGYRVGDQFGVDLRVGYDLSDSNTVYVKGGYAAQKITLNDDLDVSDKPDAQSGTFSGLVDADKARYMQGATFGLGLEHKINKTISLFADWNAFYSFGKINNTKVTTLGGGKGAAPTVKVEDNLKNMFVQSVQAGVKFNF